MYEIEKGIERPEIARPDRVTKYPWSMLEIGDSFFVPNKKLGEAIITNPENMERALAGEAGTRIVA